MGERAGDREAMERVTNELVGTHNPTTGERWTREQADQAVRERMRHVDRDLRNRGER